MHDYLPLEIIYQDGDLVAINKPHGLLVHRTKIAVETDIFAVQLLRDQLNQHVYPVHRLDRKTSGVLLFALNDECNRLMQMQFAEGKVDKQYQAVVRGYTEDTMDIDYPLRRDDGVVQSAFTTFNTLKRVEIDMPSGKYATSRYSLLDLKPTTGRMHQLRKHLAHVLHPIIGDRPHGCNKQNKIFKDKFAMDTMLLHAIKIRFNHPVNGTSVEIGADFQPEFQRMLVQLGFQESTSD